ncbi:MAG: hypothetical protein JXB15_16455 [Anaerolineales bacterium]|nr:hypothetical protein [Anaerolineales bacterium]
MSTRNLKKIFFFFLAASLILSACLPSIFKRDDTSPEAIYTMAAQTVIAQYTRAAGETAVALLTQVSSGSPTATPPEQASPTSTTQAIIPSPTATVLFPTYTPLPPTFTPLLPTFTPLPPTFTPLPPTAVPPPCDWAQFVKDVTVPDGTDMLPGQTFTKVWRLRNIGSCSWNTSYALIYVSGDRMHTYNAVGLPGIVHPGNTIDLSVEFVAPDQPGDYRSYWMLRNSYGQAFGIGPNANKPFWVDIDVTPPQSQYPYDFALSMCMASWRSRADSSLPCPGSQSSSDGSAIMLTNPELENGRRENEPTLWMRPSQTHDGWITGEYPKYKVQSGDHFMAEIGCLEDNPGCDVTFYLAYQTSGGTVKNLGSWRETYDGFTTRLDIDLSSLAGKTVQFLLTVVNNGRASKATAFWLAPSIRRSTINPEWESMPAVQAARRRVAQDTGLSASQLIPTSVAAVTWTDTCLGVHLPGQICGEALIPGYRIILTDGRRNYEVHTNQDGSILAWFEI